MMKRRISAVLLVAMLLSIFPGIPLGNKAYAEDVLKQYGDLYYTIENGEASIVGCDLEATGEIEVPSTIEGCPVVRIKEDSNYYKKGMDKKASPERPVSGTSRGHGDASPIKEKFKIKYD